MKRIVFLFSIVLMLCSCKSFEDHSNEKAVGTYKNGYILNLNKEIVATYRNGYVFSEKALGTPNDYGLGLEQDIYTTGKIEAQFKFSVASSRGANQRWCIHDTGRTGCPQCHAAVL